MRYKPYKGRKDYGWKIITTILCLLIIAVVSIILSVKAGAASWTYKQVKAHEIAEIARDMGLPEDDPIIRRASEIWYEEKAAMKNKRTETFKIYGYCPCSKCCGKSDGITATGTKATAGRTIAVDPSVIPLGSTVIIDGHEYIAEDTGAGIKGKTIDMFFDTHKEALAWGVQYREVTY